MESIKIPREIVNQILYHAQSDPEQEICGLISEKNGKISRCHPVHNIAVHPERLFLMDGKEQIDAMREMRSNDENLYAIYHSHPHSEAYPSQTDLNEAQYPDLVYLIVSLDTKGVLDLRAFRYASEGVESLEVTI